MKTFLTKFVPCFTSALLSFGFFFFVLYRISASGQDTNLILTDTFSVALMVLLISVMSSLLLVVIMPFLNQYANNRAFAKSALSRKLHVYVRRVIRSVPELRDSIKKDVRISVSLDEDLYQASAVGNNRILISYKWVLAATISKNKLEELKTTLCHELSHIKDHCDTVWWKYPALYFPRITKKALLRSWYNELRADRNGLSYYVTAGGKPIVFIRKLRFLRDIAPHKSSKTGNIGTHPCWAIRIGFIANNIIVTPDEVKKAFVRYANHLKKKRKGFF